MKSLLLGIMFSLILALPVSAGYQPYWVCMQVGTMDSSPVLVVSSTQSDRYPSTKVREVVFAKTVKKLLNIQDAYEPFCQDFPSKIRIQEVKTKLHKRTSKEGVKMLKVEFKFSEVYGKRL